MSISCILRCESLVKGVVIDFKHKDDIIFIIINAIFFNFRKRNFKEIIRSKLGITMQANYI